MVLPGLLILHPCLLLLTYTYTRHIDEAINIIMPPAPTTAAATATQTVSDIVSGKLKQRGDSSSPSAPKKYDLRFPHYLGDWLRSIPLVDEGPAQDDFDEPHYKRKRTIIDDHPEIEKLYGYDASTINVAVLATLAQVVLAYIFGRILTDWNFTMVAVAYVCGGSFATLQGVILHEVSHNLAAPTTLINRWVGNVSNIIIIVPIAQSFRRYHLEHHTYQGVEDYDPDLPLKWEIEWVRNNPVFKFFWLFIYGIMYIGRGLAMGKELSRWELYNWAWTAVCDVVLYNIVGTRGMIYMVISVILGFGFHPGAAHFIQEHYTFKDGQETYSYYGTGNKFWLNIGYHNEHHDFVKVPWSKLPEVKRIAPEYYDNLIYHTSWWGVLYAFVSSSLMAPQSRVVRPIDKHRDARKLRIPEKDSELAKTLKAKHNAEN
ncbi:sphingolipid delta-4 desaturase [Mycoemilia scoparia]|uniref:Sphingolipid delta-4 desaturase n=1 Tax=Mycoemilia scoparia TaxID=417184 RepID=A0A9W8DUK6_9FUNG|nr:sphingolipid delta-4 desaturase [Mycoemilia scoparia]